MSDTIRVSVTLAPDSAAQELGASGSSQQMVSNLITDRSKACNALVNLFANLGSGDCGSVGQVWIDVSGGTGAGRRPITWILSTAGTGAGTFVYNGTTVNFTAVTGNDTATALAIVAAIRANATVNLLVDTYVDPTNPSRVLVFPAVFARRNAADNAFTTVVTGTGISVSGATVGAGGTAPAQAGVNQATFNGFVL